MVGQCFRARCILIATCVLALSAAQRAAAQTSRQQLREALGALQADTARSDSALRERIIKLVLTLDPPPAVPDEVAELTGRAVYAFKNATSPADYEEAITAYRKALLLAPWEAKNYYNLGVVQEKAGKPTDAIESFRWYLMAAPNASDATEVRERIGGLKFAATKVAEERGREEATANAERDKRETFEAFKRAVQGSHYQQIACAAPEDAARGIDRGCSWAEFNGDNWYTKLSGYTPPLAFWVFHEDYATLECVSGCTPIRVRSEG
jgi:tetratricopeptide (TPR) repeat protein